MRIGVYFPSTKNAGGVYQYSLAILDALLRIPGNKYYVFSSSKNIPEYFWKSKRFKVVYIPESLNSVTQKVQNVLSYLITYLMAHLWGYSLLRPIYQVAQRENINMLERRKLDLIFYPIPSNLSFLVKTPAVVAVHDLMHRVHPEFHEVSARGIWENREYVYINISKHAYRILVDSEVGKKDVGKYYKTNPEKIVILPYLFPSYLEDRMSLKSAQKICKSLRLPDKFIFYPARFWPHKNHINLIEAINVLKLRGIKVNLVLTGSKDADFSSYDNVLSLIKRYGLEKQIFYLGYVDNQEISAIYKIANAMVMPTYFGPTNIPVLEAWQMGTPVIYSNIRGCREQLGNAGLLINPDGPRDIADEILKIYTQPKLAAELARRGKVRVSEWTLSDFAKKIKEIVDVYEKSKNSTPKNN